MEFEGIIKVIGKDEEINEKLRKLTFVLEENSDKEYKSGMSVELFNDKIEMIKPFKVGDIVKVNLNFRAREYNGRWFNSISAWRIEGIGSATSKDAWWEKEGGDDLPF